MGERGPKIGIGMPGKSAGCGSRTMALHAAMVPGRKILDGRMGFRSAKNRTVYVLV